MMWPASCNPALFERLSESMHAKYIAAKNLHPGCIQGVQQIGPPQNVRVLEGADAFSGLVSVDSRKSTKKNQSLLECQPLLDVLRKYQSTTPDATSLR